MYPRKIIFLSAIQLQFPRYLFHFISCISICFNSIILRWLYFSKQRGWQDNSSHFSSVVVLTLTEAGTGRQALASKKCNVRSNGFMERARRPTSRLTPAWRSRLPINSLRVNDGLFYGKSTMHLILSKTLEFQSSYEAGKSSWPTFFCRWWCHLGDLCSPAGRC